tara:strand:+ start:1393 stop:1506 length:114 start_codon:yes stop_codon:yes gene_type:complete
VKKGESTRFFIFLFFGTDKKFGLFVVVVVVVFSILFF